jgi:uncharacterized protein with HEPN domain
MERFEAETVGERKDAPAGECSDRGTPFIEDMILCMERILGRLSRLDFSAFKTDAETIDSVVRNVEILAEAARQVPAAVRFRHPQFPWSEVLFWRARVADDGFGVDAARLWGIAAEEIPGLLERLKAVYVREMTWPEAWNGGKGAEPR